MLAVEILDSPMPEVILIPGCPAGGYAALLSDGERNAEEDSANRRDFQDSCCYSLCPLCAPWFLYSVFFKNSVCIMRLRLHGVMLARGIFII